ncbi:D-TA family PLP-dependent enzyme [Croceitalea rosinachiae]|uniref:D-TA family PLP-dependent enzyme n=1 Tax=Croceitalea rosinachiae TaxID=3075596 RepID=A0ABU3AAC3_9FLAO|nr:D-TA family PLP-dependent enzyme [Croceitalea sp. F388]MDT0607133.1 D-TA family PLP-dependent enzyme [Croceitalea sp. F388]
MKKAAWYAINDSETIISPSLLVYPDRIKANIKLMLEIAGGATSLRPHIKTHKMAEVIAMQLEHGIDKFKCATIAEAELLAASGAKDVLLAMQPTGPNIFRFFYLMAAYPETHFSTIVDNSKLINEITTIAAESKQAVSLWLDINNGMHRTGVLPNDKAVALYQEMAANVNIIIEGLHVYDGHIRNSDIATRTHVCNNAFETVTHLKKQLEGIGLEVKNIVAGGTPSFPIHSKRKHVQVSPGTSLLWDYRYSSLFPDLKFLPAAVLMTRVISKPKKGYLCLDLGHKSVAPEMPLPRVQFLEDTDFEQIGQSEEHLVVTTKNSDDYSVGDVLYAVPYHICPTVAKYHEVTAITEHKSTEVWTVAARNNKITI